MGRKRPSLINAFNISDLWQDAGPVWGGNSALTPQRWEHARLNAGSRVRTSPTSAGGRDPVSPPRNCRRSTRSRPFRARRAARSIGPVQLRAYGLCIALAVRAAVAVCSRRYAHRGGDPSFVTKLAVWAVPAGIIGARLYHVVTDYELYLPSDANPLNALKIWDGGLGIWGGVAAGVLVGTRVARRHGANVGVLLDCVAPALPLAQAIGR